MKAKPYIAESISILDSEELVDKAYDSLIHSLELVPEENTPGLPIDVFGGRSRKKEMSFFNSLITGIYIPGSKRNYYWGSFDTHVDQLPLSGAVYVSPHDANSFEYANILKINRLKERVYSGCENPIATYQVNHVQFPKIKELANVYVDIAYFQVSQDGSIWIGIDRDKMRHHRSQIAFTSDMYLNSHYGPGALSLLSDRKYLWLVETSEQIKSLKAGQAKAQFGIEEEMIKSLFYSRSLPMTESGRKRPILHWVSSHKRRIERGIDVDVMKHLRGIESFMMGDLDFKITQPTKNLKKDEQLA